MLLPKSKLKGTWFHSRKSLLFGMFLALLLIATGFYSKAVIVGVLQSILGVILFTHIFRNYLYYKQHRIIKIIKTDTHRIITKE